MFTHINRKGMCNMLVAAHRLAIKDKKQYMKALQRPQGATMQEHKNFEWACDFLYDMEGIPELLELWK